MKTQYIDKYPYPDKSHPVALTGSPVSIDPDLLEDATEKGGPGSGFYGHAGRPGEQGGSVSQGGEVGLTKDQEGTAAFKKWFGRSRVVDVNGEPLPVYHGTKYQFSSFDPNQSGGMFFFAVDPQEAGFYGDVGDYYLKSEKLIDLTSIDYTDRKLMKTLIDWANDEGEWIDRGSGEDLDPISSIEGGYLYDYEGTGSGRRWRSLFKYLHGEGYDGVKINDVTDGVNAPVYVVFDPSQIKSYSKNTGEFDPGTQNLYKEYTEKGGPGSGNFGHAGRPGEQGGSAPQDGGGEAGLESGINTKKITDDLIENFGEQSFSNPAKFFIAPDGRMINVNGTTHPEVARMVYNNFIPRHLLEEYGTHLDDEYFMLTLGYVRGNAGWSSEGLSSISFNIVGELSRASADTIENILYSHPGLDVYMDIDDNSKVGHHSFFQPSEAILRKLGISLKGGPGSGNFGHAGRPGHQGGSMPHGGEVEAGFSRLGLHGSFDDPRVTDFLKDTKAVDEEGNPVIVFHGSYKRIKYFSGKLAGENTGAATAGLGIFFTDDPRVANSFAGKPTYDFSNTTAAVLSMKNPMVVDAPLENAWDDSFDLLKSMMLEESKRYTKWWRKDTGELTIEDGREYKKELERQGYDGIIIKNTSMDAYEHGHTMYIVFSPAQIYTLNNMVDFDSLKKGDAGVDKGWALSEKGGPGSGNFGHAGRPGKQGGSAPRGAAGWGKEAGAYADGKPYVGVPTSALADGVKAMNGEPSQPTGSPVRGTGISVDDKRIPKVVYHMTTNLPAVQETGALLARGVGGLGGDNSDQIVSMTIDKGIAEGLARDMKFAVEMCRDFYPTEPDYEASPEEWEAWTGPVVQRMIEHAKEEGWDFHQKNAHNIDDIKDVSKARYGPGDWLRTYFSNRDSAAGPKYLGNRDKNGNFLSTPGKFRNPLLFTDDKVFAKLDPKKIGIVSIPKKNLKTGALLTNFDLDAAPGWGLQEIRLYGDVPLAGAGFEAIKGGAGSGFFGHVGRPGKWGGSAPQGGEAGMSEHLGNQPSNIDTSGITGADPNTFHGLSEAMVKVDYEHQDASRVLSAGLDEINITNQNFDMPVSNKRWRAATDETREKIKDGIVTRISQETGISYGTVNDLIESWSMSSNDEHIQPLSLQEAASEEFGVPLSAWQKEKLDFIKGVRGAYEDWKGILRDYDHSPDRKADAEAALREQHPELSEGQFNFLTHRQEFAPYDNSALPGLSHAVRGWDEKAKSILYSPVSRETERKFLRAMYNDTQKQLEKMGVTEVTLFRGTGKTSIHVKKPAVVFTLPGSIGKAVSYHGNAMESWSASLLTAFGFGTVKLGMRVPRQNILCSARTGFGCLTEGEWVVLGNSNPGTEAQVLYA
jgi:hypothetical protein